MVERFISREYHECSCGHPRSSAFKHSFQTNNMVESPLDRLWNLCNHRITPVLLNERLLRGVRCDADQEMQNVDYESMVDSGVAIHPQSVSL